MFQKITFAALAAAAILTFNSNISSAQTYSPNNEQEKLLIAAEEKNTWKEWKLKNLQLEKKILTKQVLWNWLTPEDAKSRLQKLASWVNSDLSPQENKVSHFSANPKKIEKFPTAQSKKITKLTYQANLTAEQKSDLQNWRKEKSALKKDLVQQKLSWGVLDEKQAAHFLKKLSQWDSENIFFKPPKT